MKRFLSILAIAVFMALAMGCGPSKHIMHLEMRYPSKSGIELAGKMVSVVYLQGKDSVAASFAESMAEGFASAIEEEYGTGNGSVGLYRLEARPGAGYSSRDTLFNLLMQTEGDVVFLLDTVDLGKMEIGGATRVAAKSSADSSFVSLAKLPFSIRLYGFDAMNQDEKIYTFGGSSIARPDVYSDGSSSVEQLMSEAYHSLPEEAMDAGAQIADSFRSQWKHEQYSVVYYNTQKWYDALEKALRYDWKGAMDIWFGFLDTNDLMKRACAEYDIALCCYMLGDYRLAELWLDRSDADNKLPAVSESLRKRIEARKSFI